MRESGKAYLAKNPGAFGGGIDPKSGVRSVGGQRVSVTTPEEEKAGAAKISLEQARTVETQQQTKEFNNQLFDIERTREGRAGAYEITYGGQTYSVRGTDVRKFIEQKKAQDVAIEQARRRQEDEQKREQFKKGPTGWIPEPAETIIHSKVMETYTSPSGTTVPITETRAYDYTSVGPFKYYKERDATPEEKMSYEDYKSSVKYTPQQEKTFLGNLKQSYKSSDFAYKVEGLKNEQFINTDWVGDKAYTASKRVLPALLPGVSKDSQFVEKSSRFIGGTTKAFLPDTKGQLAVDTAIYAVSAGVGAGLRLGEAALVTGSTKLASKYPKFAPYISKAPTTYKIGEVATGSLLVGGYVYGVGKNIVGQEDYGKKGEAFGKGAKDIVIVGAGFSGGGKVGDKILGKISTRSIKDVIPVEKLVPENVLSGAERFPVAPTKTHLKLFRENAIKFESLGEGRPGGFHATGTKWWNEKLTPGAGTSELPGTYFGSYVSPNFLRLGRSSSYVPTSMKAFKDLFKARGVSRVSYAVPEGFRYAGFKKVVRYDVDGQSFKYKFKKKTKEGYIDIPGMKTEIEGVARVDAGSYLDTGRKAKFNINGVDVGIDVFQYEKLSALPKKGSRGGGKGGTKYRPSSEPVPVSIYNPSSTALSSVIKNSSYGLSSSQLSSYRNSISKSSGYSRGSSISRASSGVSSSFISSGTSSGGRSSGSSGSSYSRGSSGSRSSYSPRPYSPMKIPLPKISLKVGKIFGKKKKRRAKEIEAIPQDFTSKALNLKALRYT